MTTSGPSLEGVAGLRVLAFCDWYTPDASGGAERAAWEVYRRLGAAGADVRVIGAMHGTPYDDPGVTVHDVPSIDLSRLVGGYFAPAPLAFRVAQREYAAFHPHVLHATTIHHTCCVAAAWLAHRHSLPLVGAAHLGSMEHLPLRTRMLGTTWDRTLGRYILRRSTRVLAVSNAVRTHVIDLGARADTIEVAPNGVDHVRFDLPPLTAGKTPTVMAIGRLIKNKGFGLLVEAAGMLAAEGHEFDLVFVGEGPLRSALESAAAQAGLSQQVSFVGQVTDVERWLSRADIVVRPSFTEGLSLAVIEAMAAGRCNIVSDIEPNLELVTDDVNGLTFRCGDSADLARKLRLAVSNADLRLRLAHRARVDAQAYTWESTAEHHARALCDLVGSSGTAGGKRVGEQSTEDGG